MSTHRSSLCVFTFADGRRCRTPRYSNHPHFCYYHARKEAQAMAGQQVADDVAWVFSRSLVTASDLNLALTQLFAAIARGHIKTRPAATLAYLAQTLLQNLNNAKGEYVHACGPIEYRRALYSSIVDNFNYHQQKASQQLSATEADEDHSDPRSGTAIDVEANVSDADNRGVAANAQANSAEPTKPAAQADTKEKASQ